MNPSGTDWRTFAFLSRGLVAVVFLMAAYGKIEDPAGFAESVAAYRVAPMAWVNPIALWLPWLEVLAAVLLLAGVWRAASGWTLGLLLVGFTGLKVYAELAGVRISCGCFTGIFKMLSDMLDGWRGILLNVVLIGCVLVDLIALHRARAVATGRAAGSNTPASESREAAAPEPVGQTTR